MTVPAGKFKAQCLQMLDDVQQNRREIVITKPGKAVARLVPLETEVPQLFGRMKGTFEIIGDIIGPTGEKWDAES
jgi:antitoxin (DNA-binding transcriptional repressor) of toxin-antitoxin stability system